MWQILLTIIMFVAQIFCRFYVTDWTLNYELLSFALQICILALPYNSLCTSFTDQQSIALPYNSLCTSFTDQQSMYSLYRTTIYVIDLRFNNLCTRFTYNSLCTRYTVQQSMYSLYRTTVFVLALPYNLLYTHFTAKNMNVHFVKV